MESMQLNFIKDNKNRIEFVFGYQKIKYALYGNNTTVGRQKGY